MVSGVAPLDRAGPGDLVFLDNPRTTLLTSTPRWQARAWLRRSLPLAFPRHTVALVTPQPYRAFAQVTAKLFPDAMRPGSVFGSTGIAPGAFVHPSARLEPGVTVDPGAVVGPGAEIGTGTVIASNAVIGPQVRIGRNCSVGPNATLLNALIGDRVIVHPGVRIGQDGFGFALGPQGHLKVPQVGRVIVQNDVEIGANSTIDRGANRDTVIGEGTKIDNLVQIAPQRCTGPPLHHRCPGRDCGQRDLEDFVALGGQVGVVGHVRIGAGAQIAGSSNVAGDVPAGSRWGGTPAKPIKEWFRELTLVVQSCEAKGRRFVLAGSQKLRARWAFHVRKG